MTFNLHHLELFYYVANFQGISAAVREMPYGIQQPAVSSQVALLEKSLGVRLFHRRPFQLTEAGLELYEFCQPFFSGIYPLADKISGKANKKLRLAAPASVIRYHLPEILEQLRDEFPTLEVQLFDSNETAARELLSKGKVDLAITEIEISPPQGVHFELLIELPLTLFIPADIKARSLDLEQLCSTSALIRPNDNYTVSRLFEKGLKELALSWKPTLRINSFNLQLTYVSKGFGVGLGVQVPLMPLPKDVYCLDLEEFPMFRVGAAWRGDLGEPAARVLEELRQFASKH